MPSRPPRVAPLLLPLCALALLALAGCAPSAGGPARLTLGGTPSPAAAVALPPDAYTADLRPDLAYGPLSGESLDLCIPKGAVTARPGVLLIHGGAWSGGDKGMYDDFCRQLAEHGFVGAAMNYRLAPAAPWPAQLVDAQLAVRWLRASAGQFALDPARLCAYGDSAGGQLAVYLGSDAAIHPGDEAALHADQSSKASCVVDAFGPVDLTLQGATSLQQSILRTLFGGATLAGDPAAYRDASPLFLVSPTSAPTLIIQGTRDTLVPPSQSQALKAALQSAHVPVQYVSYDGDHAFAGLNSQQIDGIILQAAIFLTAQERP
jgi:acetyl esterase/lipase